MNRSRNDQAPAILPTRPNVTLLISSGADCGDDADFRFCASRKWAGSESVSGQQPLADTHEPLGGAAYQSASLACST